MGVAERVTACFHSTINIGLKGVLVEADMDERVPDKKARLWAWHAQCVANADAAKARGDRREWHEWSKAAAEVLEKLA